MTIEIYISIFGALTAVAVSVISALLANRNSISLQTRKLKEDHYIDFIEACHNNGAHNDIEGYTLARDKMFLIAKEIVIKKLLDFESKGIGQEAEKHDYYLTEMIKEIRKDLGLRDNDFPQISLQK